MAKTKKAPPTVEPPAATETPTTVDPPAATKTPQRHQTWAQLAQSMAVPGCVDARVVMVNTERDIAEGSSEPPSNTEGLLFLPPSVILVGQFIFRHLFTILPLWLALGTNPFRHFRCRKYKVA